VACGVWDVRREKWLLGTERCGVAMVRKATGRRPSTSPEEVKGTSAGIIMVCTQTSIHTYTHTHIHTHTCLGVEGTGDEVARVQSTASRELCGW
jgi:hypothetical protein